MHVCMQHTRIIHSSLAGDPYIKTYKIQPLPSPPLERIEAAVVAVAAAGDALEHMRAINLYKTLPSVHYDTELYCLYCNSFCTC